MREIKFRAWHKKQAKMYSPEEMGQDQLTLMPDGRGFANISGQDVRLSRIDNGLHMIPMQYTGLKDKNGKEIYEGDIVTANYKVMTSRYSVVIRDGHTCLDARPSSSVLSFHLDIANTELYEVIGNIYENPKLLKGA